jgi:CRISPR-associated protein Cas2
MDCHQADAAEQATWRSSSERQTGTEWHLLGPAVAKACRDYGQRVQYSVFEVEVDPAQWTKLRSRLEGLIKPEHDSLRYYYLGANWRRRVEHVGAKPAVDLGGPLIV